MAARQRGESIPEGWALDAQGRPATDPAAALGGTMIPVGDAKGSALALMVEILAAALTGANYALRRRPSSRPKAPRPASDRPSSLLIPRPSIPASRRALRPCAARCSRRRACAFPENGVSPSASGTGRRASTSRTPSMRTCASGRSLRNAPFPAASGRGLRRGHPPAPGLPLPALLAPAGRGLPPARKRRVPPLVSAGRDTEEEAPNRAERVRPLPPTGRALCRGRRHGRRQGAPCIHGTGTALEGASSP